MSIDIIGIEEEYFGTERQITDFEILGRIGKESFKVVKSGDMAVLNHGRCGSKEAHKKQLCPYCLMNATYVNKTGVKFTHMQMVERGNIDTSVMASNALRMMI